MTRSRVAAILILCGAALLAACVTPRPGQKQLTIELDGNPTTGFSWTYTMSPDGIVRESASGFRQHPVASGVVGVGGSFLFVFAGIAPGETELKFSYARSWEKGAPARTAVYVLKVSDDLMVTARKKE